MTTNPEDPGRPDVEAAVREAYTEDGQATWWTAWRAADATVRRRMETGVLIEWSGELE